MRREFPILLHKPDGVFRMAWENRKDSRNRYYYRSRRLPDGRVVKTYHGTGLRGALAASTDRAKRAERDFRLTHYHSMLQHIEHVAAGVVDVCENCDVIMEAALLAAGYHNHRGEWRKKSHGRQNSNTH